MNPDLIDSLSTQRFSPLAFTSLCPESFKHRLSNQNLDSDLMVKGSVLILRVFTYSAGADVGEHSGTGPEAVGSVASRGWSWSFENR